MKGQVLIVIALLIAALGLAGCPTKSEAERCKDSGGVWRGTFCETQASESSTARGIMSACLPP